MTDNGPHFLLEETRGRDVSDAPQDTRGRRRRGAVLVTAGLALGALVPALSMWDQRGQELVQPVPVVAAPPPLRFSAGVAPVIPPAEFFSSVKP